MLVLVIIVVTFMGCVGLGRVAAATLVAARADAAADVAALAAVAGGRTAAEQVAEANSARVAAYAERSDGAVQVRIERAGYSSVAAAAPEGEELDAGHASGPGQR